MKALETMKAVRTELKNEWKKTRNTETMFAIMEIEIQIAKKEYELTQA